MDYNLPFLEKLNFASFRNGGFAQNGHKNCFFYHNSVNIGKFHVFSFDFSYIYRINHRRKVFCPIQKDSKWRLKFKLGTNFQSAVTLVLMIFFSKFLLHFAFVENG
jgi:hypothetical protein